MKGKEDVIPSFYAAFLATPMTSWTSRVAIKKSQVRFPVGRSCVTTAGKLFTPCDPVTKQYNLLSVNGR